MPALGALLGDRSVGAVTIGQALHWMNHDELFGALAPLAQRDGGVTVVTNGTPLSLQDSTWSRALRGVLEAWSGTKTTGTCGTDEQSQQRYREALTGAGFDVLTAGVDYTAELNFDQIGGGLCSALPSTSCPRPTSGRCLLSGPGVRWRPASSCCPCAAPPDALPKTWRPASPFRSPPRSAPSPSR